MAPPTVTLDDRQRIGGTEKVKTGTGKRGRENTREGECVMYSMEPAKLPVVVYHLEIGQTSSPRPEEETCAPDGDKEVHLLLLDIGFAETRPWLCQYSTIA